MGRADGVGLEPEPEFDSEFEFESGGGRFHGHPYADCTEGHFDSGCPGSQDPASPANPAGPDGGSLSPGSGSQAPRAYEAIRKV